VYDDDLTAALADDLAGSFERLVLTYQGRLFASALRLTGDPRDAEEIAQDTFVRAHQALARYERERVRTLALRPWLYQIVLNLVRNRRRVRRVAVVPLELPDGTWRVEPAAGDDDQPEARLVRLERQRDLARYLDDLPSRLRTAVVLRHVAGLGYGEVATVLGQPVGTVKANVHRGVRQLRAALTATSDVR
jgi:RNA polymerase sigma-70 factor (ECF subfamily)